MLHICLTEDDRDVGTRRYLEPPLLSIISRRRNLVLLIGSLEARSRVVGISFAAAISPIVDLHLLLPFPALSSCIQSHSGKSCMKISFRRERASLTMISGPTLLVLEVHTTPQSATGFIERAVLSRIWRSTQDVRQLSCYSMIPISRPYTRAAVCCTSLCR